MAYQHTALITAAGGNIGSALVPRLLSSPSVKLVLPTSNASRLQAKVPSANDVAIKEGSISEPLWLQSILTKHNVDTVFLCLTGTDELLTSLNFFDAMKRAGCVKHLIYLSAYGDFVSDEGVRNVMLTHSAAHVIVKSTLEQKLAYGNYPWTTTVLGPTLFFTNDLRSKTSMLNEGIFDEPLGEKGESRVSTEDIALVVHNLILRGSSYKHAGKKIMIGSLKWYTGFEVASLWSKALGRDIKMMSSDDESLSKFEHHFAQKMGVNGDWGRDLRLMYETFASSGFGMSNSEYEVQCEVLGKEPEEYDAWVMKTGKKWRE